MSRSSADKRDIYYRLCKSEGYRARSAYKLLHLDEEFSLFRGVKTACDFCAAPGSWSQVLTRKLRPKGALGVEDVQIVSVDLQPMAPLPHVTTLHADITVPSTVDLMLSHMNGRKADLIVCDGAPEVTGVHDLDAYLHGQLLIAVSAGPPLFSIRSRRYTLRKKRRELMLIYHHPRHPTAGIYTRPSSPRSSFHTHLQSLPPPNGPQRRNHDVSISVLFRSTGWNSSRFESRKEVCRWRMYRERI